MTTSENVLEVYRYAFDCARSGDGTWLAAFIEAGGSADLTNDKGDTLLILAAYHARVEAVSILLAAGADVERVNDNGQTALAAAVFRRSRELVELFLTADANPDTGTRSATTIATFFGLDDMAELLTEHR
ncbi:ankyrin repeat domain-containing protein [Rhodococcus sp. H36-A4]|uniref:ankyrin repeat domain-containing protein n=1 Tax=Rhodococcus sp. H36-A4 TaxID=3004353 RepID=UPI0022AFB6BD|nr:ankyrin repeat domain-containing protein [Rhodococcus sp. H36-A4]MCZ4076507.1 ankyrin repeat domain-containing protein [Rhodococcus sp. H36-A4]